MANGNGITGATLTDSGDLYIETPIILVGLPDAPILTAQATASLDSGSVGSILLDSEGTYYTAVPTITIEAPPSGTTATATASYANGRITSISIIDSGDGYLTVPSVTISAPTGSPGDFKASVGANIANEKITSLYVIDSGDFYTTPPSITISEPISSARFIIGETVHQEAFSDGTILTGEVSAYADSDDQLSLIHVGTLAANGAFHEPTSGLFVTGQESQAKAKIIKVTEQTVLGDQNDIFAAEIEDFVDFSEVNPFGEPANSEAHEH